MDAPVADTLFHFSLCVWFNPKTHWHERPCKHSCVYMYICVLYDVNHFALKQEVEAEMRSRLTHVVMWYKMCIINTHFCDPNLLFPELFQRFDKQVACILHLQERMTGEYNCFLPKVSFCIYNRKSCPCTCSVWGSEVKNCHNAVTIEQMKVWVTQWQGPWVETK